ncbi:MAG: hypothetical protein ABI402_01495 [Ferruginibacter sp.]
MKANNVGVIDPINKNEIEETIKEINSTYLQEKVARKQPFCAIDLWRMQKKHRTLGSSTRW